MPIQIIRRREFHSPTTRGMNRQRLRVASGFKALQIPSSSRFKHQSNLRNFKDPDPFVYLFELIVENLCKPLRTHSNSNVREIPLRSYLRVKNLEAC